jgi:hypothetical protein
MKDFGCISSKEVVRVPKIEKETIKSKPYIGIGFLQWRQPKVQGATNENTPFGVFSICALGRNRTCIASTANLHSIH